LFCTHSVNGLVFDLNDYIVDIVYLYINVYYILNTNGVGFRSEHSADDDSAGDNMRGRDDSNHLDTQGLPSRYEERCSSFCVLYYDLRLLLCSEYTECMRPIYTHVSLV
jgi:hypothetical protein